AGMGQKNSIFDMKLKAKEWQWELGREAKHLDKEIAKIQKDEAKLQDQIRLQAEKGNVEAVQLLAKSVVKTRKAVQRLEKTK
ncbi:chmp3, partial [Symbiodinium necroappetens]